MNEICVGTFESRFPSEAACAEWLFQVRWPEGFRCPSCDYAHAIVISTRRLPLYECRQCHRQTSITAGTILEKSRTPLRKWLYAMWLISQTEEGINAVRLQSLLSVAYKTAFYMLRKLRLALGSSEAQPALTGNVQAGLDYLGRGILSTLESVEGRKQPIMTAVSKDNNGHFKQIAVTAVPPDQVRQRMLLPMGQTIFAERYIDPQVESVEIARSLLLTNRHFKNLRIYGKSIREWIIHTFHGLGSRYLQTYLDEFVFRVNASMQGISPFEAISRLSMHSSREVARPAHSVAPLFAA